MSIISDLVFDCLKIFSFFFFLSDLKVVAEVMKWKVPIVRVCSDSLAQRDCGGKMESLFRRFPGCAAGFHLKNLCVCSSGSWGSCGAGA